MKKRIYFAVIAVVAAVLICIRMCGRGTLDETSTLRSKAAAEDRSAPKENANSNDIQILKRTGKAFTEVAKKAIPAVVFIHVEKTVEMRGQGEFGQFNDPFGFFGDEFFERFFRGRGLYPAPRRYRQFVGGSGFIISRDGYILTNNHVVGDADKITVKLHDGRELEAKRIGTDPMSEVAVIKIEGDHFPFLELGDSSALEIGEWVIAVGNQFELFAETVTVGVVSAKGRSGLKLPDVEYQDFIQTDAAINPGNSGGPLLNIDSEVIGINTAIYSRSGGYMGIGFAIPINMAKTVKDQLIKTGKVVRGHVGIVISDVAEDMAEQFGLEKAEGILISQVMEGSPGEKAGLKHGDIILKINGKKVENVAAFRSTVAFSAPGTKFVLTVFRNGKAKGITVKTGVLSDETMAMTGTSELFEELGMTLENLTQDIATRFGYEMGSGVVVSQVRMDDQAARVGIQPGSLIMSVGRKKVSNVEEFVEAVETTKRRGKILLWIRGDRYSQYVIMRVE